MVKGKELVLDEALSLVKSVWLLLLALQTIRRGSFSANLQPLDANHANNVPSSHRGRNLHACVAESLDTNHSFIKNRRIIVAG